MNSLDGSGGTEGNDSVWLQALNSTGNWLIDIVPWLPVDVLVIGMGIGVVCMWYENLRCWLRIQRRNRVGRQLTPEEKYE